MRKGEAIQKHRSYEWFIVRASPDNAWQLREGADLIFPSLLPSAVTYRCLTQHLRHFVTSLYHVDVASQAITSALLPCGISIGTEGAKPAGRKDKRVFSWPWSGVDPPWWLAQNINISRSMASNGGSSRSSLASPKKRARS